MPRRTISLATVGLATSALIASMWAAPVTASADLPTTVHAAAHLGADALDDTSLPTTLSDGTTELPVTWTFDADTFSEAYGTVEVPGLVDGQLVTAQVEVIPPAQHPLVYFVDAGHGGDSQNLAWSRIQTNSNAFNGVSSLANDLHNTVPDQRYVAGQTDWGFTHGTGNHNYKLTIPGGDPSAGNLEALNHYDKFRLGVRTNHNSISHNLTLAPGTYTLSSGFFEFYASGQGRNRGITPTVSWTVNGAAGSSAMSAVLLNTPANQATEVMATDVFTIPADASNVRLTYAQSSGEGPMVSWYAIAQGDARAALAGEPEPPAHPTTDVTINAADIAADNVNGLTFKGFGVLSANSTSSLLMDYKAQQPEKYEELLEVLFGGDHPIMHHVKIEMGNDRNTSTGPDPATMRRSDEEANVLRHPGFQLAADAKRYNPDLAVSILRWVAPAWATTEDAIYRWYKNTILAAHREYGYMVDYLNPGVNEHAANLATTKQWHDRIRTDSVGYLSEDQALAGFREGEQELYRQIRLVISDEVGIGSFGGAMVNDADLRNKVDVAAFHYNTNDDSQGNFKRLATQFDKQVWNSEAQATFSNSAFRPNNNLADPSIPGTGLGGVGSSLEMANTVVKGFVNSHRTHFIYQPAIGSFYEGGQYSFKELVSARDPWSGWMHYDAGLAVLQHFSNFAVTGWENSDNTAGIWRAVPQASHSTATGTNPVVGRNGEPNFMTLAAPDASDFSTVIVNDSEISRTYVLRPVGFDLAADHELAIWETRAADDGERFDANYKNHVADVAATAGAYRVTVKPFSIVTVTSLDVAHDKGWTTPLPVSGERTVLGADNTDGVLWADDFNYAGKTVGEETFIDSRGGVTGFTPLYTWDRQGSWEGFRAVDGEVVLRQQLDTQSTGVPGAWNYSDPITGIGDRRWTNYTASVDLRFERTGVASNYGVLGVRGRGASGSGGLDTTPYAVRVHEDGTWQFLRRGAVIGSGSVAGPGWDPSAWTRLSVTAAGNQVTAAIDGTEVFSHTDPTPYLAGFVDLASGFHHTQFDNLLVEEVDGYLPFYGEHLDNMEMHDLAEVSNERLVYDGQWRHANGGAMHEFQRSRSTSQAVGAGVSLAFTGSGLDIIGGNGYGLATFDVYVDGELLVQNASTQPADWFQASYSLRGLAWGEHTVRLEVTSGALTIDAVGVMSAPATGSVAADALVDALADARAVERDDDFTDASWALLQRIIGAAAAAVDDPAAFGLDGEGLQHIIDRLLVASNPVVADIIDVEVHHLATWVGEAPALPETVTATLTDGATIELPVDWGNVPAATFSSPWTVVEVTGSHGPLAVTARVEVVPRGTVAFADVQGSAAGQLGQPSPAWLAIDDLAGGLVNDAPDQERGSGATWGHWGQNASGSRAINGKGLVTGAYDKTVTTGIYTSNQVGAALEYTFDLPAGEYTIVGGSHSWWADYSRSANVHVVADGTTIPAGTVTLNTGNPSQVLSQDVTLAEAGPVTLRLTATNNESPMLSWAAAVRKAPAIPEDIAHIESPHLATWQGEAPHLPETLTATLGDQTTVEVPVTWDTVVATAFDGAWDTVQVNGSVDDVAVTARVEVVPEGTVAFADVQGSAAGILGQESPAWRAIDILVGGLVNDSPDQVREEGSTWGHFARDAAGQRDVQAKGLVAGPYSKTTTTGVMTANQVGAEVEYTFDLAAGEYTIVAASHSWWTNNARSSAVTVLHGDQTVPVTGLLLDSTTPSRILSHDVVVAEAGPVTVRFTATNAQSPMLSWAAVVEREEAPEPTEEPSEEPTEEPTDEPTEEPTDEPTDEPTQGPTTGPSPSPTPTVTVTTTAAPLPGDLYSTPGLHLSGGRQWFTSCEPYSQTIRCRTEILGAHGWVFNSLTYLPYMTRAQWAGNPLGHAGSWTAADGRRWKTECDTAVTGRNGCRSSTWSSTPGQGWVFNNIVRFRMN